ncbi:MAG: hypothetical protein ACI970_000656, partial [Myxococcota bacterium]
MATKRERPITFSNISVMHRARPNGQPASRTLTPMSSRAAAALVFVTSAAVLVLETLAGRLLAPYAGVTLETFTA